MNEVRLKNIVHYDEKALLHSQDTIQTALNAMSENAVSSVVVINDDHSPIGIFTEYDAIKIIADTISLNTPLSEVMSTNIFSVPDSKYLHDAYLLLTNTNYRHLVVVNERQEYVGMVSEGDFLRLMSLEHLGSVSVVEKVMDRTPLIVQPEASVRHVAKLMNEQHCDYAIITKDNAPIGVIDERTIAHHIIHSTQNTEESIKELISSKIHLISKESLLQDAAKQLTQHGVHQLIVVNEQKQVIGLLKRFEVLKAIHGSYFEFLVSTIEKKSAVLEKLVGEQKLLAEQTTLLDTVINTISDPVWVKDSEGTYITCNNTFERLYNAKRSEIVGKNDFDFVPKETADFFRAHDRYALEQGIPLHNEEYLVFKDGSYEGMFETIKTVVKDAEENVFGVLGIARDISERKKNEEQLRAAEELAGVGSWTWDIKNNIFSGSDEALKIYGVKELGQIDMEQLLAIVHPDDREMIEQKLLEALQTGHYEMVHRIIVAGETKWIAGSAKFFKDESGSYVKAQGMLQDVTVQKLYELELEKLANYDTLTGLANRTNLLAHVKKLICRNQRNNKNSALLLFDLDHFRDINDSFGHNTGDELLIEVSKRMQQRQRKEDLVAHLGADEFVLVLEQLQNREDAVQVAQEISDLLSEPYLLSNDIDVHISVSIGIVLIEENMTDENQILQFADVALYKAKNEGRNCFHFYSNELTASVQERIRYQKEMFYALQNNEFELYYQPQVHIETDRIIGVEALIRWNHPEKGLLSPAVFIPIAEESGLIARIGEWTLYEACRQGKQWLDAGYDIHVSVNVSMQQLRHQDLVEVVDNALQTSGFEADKLVLELTESAMMKHEKELETMLHTLRSKGISIAIDDFGTGYSSYSYLKKFPIDILKIDKSFIDDIPYKKDALAIVKAIISMSEILDYQILAEGVEYPEQAEFLFKQRCHYYQGYLKSRPLDVQALEGLLNSNE